MTISAEPANGNFIVITGLIYLILGIEQWPLRQKPTVMGFSTPGIGFRYIVYTHNILTTLSSTFRKLTVSLMNTPKKTKTLFQSAPTLLKLLVTWKCLILIEFFFVKALF